MSESSSVLPRSHIGQDEIPNRVLRRLPPPRPGDEPDQSGDGNIRFRTDIVHKMIAQQRGRPDL